MVVADLKEDQPSLVPPLKRGRYDQLEWSSNRYVMMNDRTSLIEATRQMILLERPDLIDLFQTLSKSWQAPPSRWPSTPLTSIQHRMANEGLISMDSETCRWNVKLSQLLTDPQVQPPAPPSFRKPVAAEINIAPSVSAAAAAAASAAMHATSSLSMGGAEDGGGGGPGSAGASELWLPKLGSLIENCQPQCSLRDSGWQGVLARVDKKKTPVKLLAYAGNIVAYIQSLNNVLSISLRSPHDEMLKKEFVAFGFLQNATPLDPASCGSFQQYITYFEERNRAGVIRVNEADNTMLYVIPLSVLGVSDVLSQYHIDLSCQPTLLLIVAKAACSLD